MSWYLTWQSHPLRKPLRLQAFATEAEARAECAWYREHMGSCGFWYDVEPGDGEEAAGGRPQGPEVAPGPAGPANCDRGARPPFDEEAIRVRIAD